MRRAVLGVWMLAIWACSSRPVDLAGKAFSLPDAGLGEGLWNLASRNLEPETGAWLGLDVGVTDFITKSEAICGNRPYRLQQLYQDWFGQNFDAAFLRQAVVDGYFPVVTLAPRPPTGYSGYPLQAIIDGLSDDVIIRQARLAAAVGAPFFLRFGNEPNGRWQPAADWSWQGVYNGCEDRTATTCDGPDRFIKAYRRVHDIFVAEGASNVVWIWAINNADDPATGWNHWSNYYPGDEYVDWTGINGYNWATGPKWVDFVDLFQRSYTELAAYGKPIMVTETGTVETASGKRSDWLKAAHSALLTLFPRVRGIIFVDHTVDGADFSLTTSSDSLTQFCTSFVADPYFSPPLK